MPYDIVVDREEKYAYVSCYGSNQVSVVDLELQREIYRLKTGSEPVDLSLYDDTLLVPHSEGVDIFDISEAKQLYQKAISDTTYQHHPAVSIREVAARKVEFEEFAVTLHEAALVYLCGVDPAIRWKAWGARGSHVDGDKSALREQNEEAAFVMRKVNDPKIQRAIEDFANESIRLLEAFLVGDEKKTEQYTHNKTFYFVCGIMRSGGTYIFQETSSCLGIPWNKLSFLMSHDSIPTYNLLANYYHPRYAVNLLFEICQFLVWVNRETEGQRYVVQKRIAAAHAIPFLESIFGEQAEYLITIRHPGAAGTSFAEMEGIDEEKLPAQSPRAWKPMTLRSNFVQDWEALDYQHQYLFFWQAYYMDIVRSGLALDRIHPIEYGDAFPRFVQELAKQNNSAYRPVPFEARERRYHSFWHSDEVKEVIKRVRRFWGYYNLKFGELENIL